MQACKNKKSMMGFVWKYLQMDGQTYTAKYSKFEYSISQFLQEHWNGRE